MSRLERFELRRSYTVPDRSLNGNVLQFEPGGDTTEHEPAAAHIPTADKMNWKGQLSAKDRQQHVHVLAGRNASKQHDLALGSNRFAKGPRGVFQWLAVQGITDVDIGSRKSPEGVDGNERIGRTQPGIRRYDEHAVRHHGVRGIGGSRKTARIRELAAEVEPAYETEDVAEGRARSALQPTRKLETRPRREDHLRAAAGTVRR